MPLHVLLKTFSYFPVSFKINKQDLIGNTALHIACEHEQVGCPEYLKHNNVNTKFKPFIVKSLCVRTVRSC